MIDYPEQLLDRVGDLLRDTAPLFTFAGLGFEESDEKRAGPAIKAVGGGDWTFVDLRASDPSGAKDALERALKSKKPVVALVKAKNVQRPLQLLVRAVVDKMKEFDFGDHKKLVRPEHASFVVIVEGASQYGMLEAELQKVPYWDFIR